MRNYSVLFATVLFACGGSAPSQPELDAGPGSDGGVPVRPCVTNEECDDGVDCTTESCGDDGFCVYEADHSACDNADVCDGAEVCAVDLGCQPGALPAPARECREDVDPDVELGTYHTCAVDPLGYLYCWGSGFYGQLGYGELGETAGIGDTTDRLPEQIGPVGAPNGEKAPLRYVTQVVAGINHTCAMLNTGAVLCWGLHDQGQLGYGPLGDRATDPDPLRPTLAAPLDEPLDLGGNATQISAGDGHTCALLDTGKVRCWGRGLDGVLGYPTGEPSGPGEVDPKLNIGDDETPADVGDLDIGGNVVQISAGGQHTCALLDDGNVRCWGNGDSGQLGYSNTDSVGDQETPATVGNIQLGGKAIQVAAGGSHTCALLEGGIVRCWGQGNRGQLGYGTIEFNGDQLAGNELGETPAELAASFGDVPVGGTVTQITAGGEHTCALLDTGKVRCWGRTENGRLGYGNIEQIGDNETAADVGDVPLGETKVTKVTAGAFHTCAILESGGLRCWGRAEQGQLGYGNENDIGDNDTPANVGDVPLGVSLKP
jgi:alpha-tubulin suppressor-like RCC1 family protein